MKGPDLIVFTNGCFDIIHVGHIHLLKQAKSMGAKLIVGLNSDLSVSRLKGPSRPVNNQTDRLLVLNSIRYVDQVIIFDQDDPLDLIMTINPNVLVKGSDYTKDNIIGAEFVISNGGSVRTVDLIDGKSSSNIIKRLDDQ
jgi:rfaE bifunctional protein nucleotidyltransferase chain/domain